MRPSWDFGLGPGRLEALWNESAEVRGESPGQLAWKHVKASRAMRACLLLLALVGLTSLFAPLLPLPSPMALALETEPRPPRLFGSGQAWSAADYWELNPLDEKLLALRAKLFGEWQTPAWMGTDAKGRDMLARIVWGSRTSILVALAATLCSLLVGVSYGATAGYFGGRVDNWMMRVVDVLYSIPFIFLVIFLISVLNEYRSELSRLGVGPMTVFYVVIGLVYWLTMARVVRGQVLALRESEFIQAARAQGASFARILGVHLIPNTLSVVIVYLTLTVPSVMLFEAFLSFLGLGVAPPKVSWGLLAAESIEAINPIHTFWWLVVWPAAAMGSTLLALNVLGDGLRDALDPRHGKSNR